MGSNEAVDVWTGTTAEDLLKEDDLILLDIDMSDIFNILEDYVNENL